MEIAEKEKVNDQQENQQKKDCEINIIPRNTKNKHTETDKEKEKRTITLKEYEARRLKDTKQ